VRYHTFFVNTASLFSSRAKALHLPSSMVV